MTILRFFEKCYNHRQLFVKIANNYNIQQKNWENFWIMKNIFQNHRQIFVVWAKVNNFSVNSGTGDKGPGKIVNSHDIEAFEAS